MTIQTQAEALALIDGGKVIRATDVSVGKTGARKTSFRWYLRDGKTDPQITGAEAALLTRAFKASHGRGVAAYA